MIFTGHGARHHYRVVTRTQWTSTEGQVPIAVFDRLGRVDGVNQGPLGNTKLCGNGNPGGCDGIAGSGLAANGAMASWPGGSPARLLPAVLRRGSLPIPTVDRLPGRPRHVRAAAR